MREEVEDNLVSGLIGSLDVEEVILIIGHFRCKILYPLDYIIIMMMMMVVVDDDNKVKVIQGLQFSLSIYPLIYWICLLFFAIQFINLFICGSVTLLLMSCTMLKTIDNCVTL